MPAPGEHHELTVGIEGLHGPGLAARIALVAFPLLFVVGDLLRIGTSEASWETLIRDVGAHRERWFWGTLVSMVAIGIGGTAGTRAIADLTREAWPRATAVASGLVTVGAFAGVAVMTTDLLPWLATDPRARPGADSAVELVVAHFALGLFYGFASLFQLGLMGQGALLALSGRRGVGPLLVVAAAMFLVGRAANTDPLRFTGDALLVAAAIATASAPGRRYGGSSAPG